MTSETINSLPKVAKTINEFPQIVTVDDPSLLFFHARDETRPVGDRTVIISFATILSAINFSTLTLSEIFLVITQDIPAATILDITTSGTNYTLAGSSVTDLGATAQIFNENAGIEVNRNGVEQERGTDVIWVSSTRIRFNFTLQAGETISIQKTE